MSLGIVDRPTLGPCKVPLRPYQEEAIAAIRGEFASGQRSTLLVLATGLGKTIILGMVTRKAIEKGKKVLILAHRTELITQAANKLDLLGVEAGIEKGDQYARSLYEPDAVIATVQTMQGDRLRTWPRDHFDLIVTDECFPAGTLIDGRPIEDIRPGDEVTSFNEVEWVAERRPVVRLFRKRPSGLVRVHLDDGSSFVCTPEHPIFTYSERLIPTYVAAKDLMVYNMVYAITPLQRSITNGNHPKDVRRVRCHLSAPELEQHYDPGLFGGMQGEAEGCPCEGRDASLLPVRGACGLPWDKWSESGKERPSILLGSLPRCGRSEDVVGSHGGNKSSPCVGKDEGQESDERFGCTREDADDNQGDGLEAAGARGQWDRANRPTDAPRFLPGMGDGVHRAHVSAKDKLESPAVALQDRHRESDAEDRDRGGRRLPLWTSSAIAGPEEGGLSPVARVVRVEVLEPGSDGRFGGLCPDGLVYNLEVEGNHNYFADGLLVHNCHHATAGTYQSIYKHFPKAFHLGVTATWDRADEDDVLEVFGGSVAYEMDMLEGMEAGPPGPWLAKLRPKYIDVGIDLRNIRTTGGDLNADDLVAAITPYVETLANAIRQLIGTRQTIVFTPDVGSSTAMATALGKLGFRADWSSGDDPHRESKVERYLAGEIQVMCNCQLFTEGFDAPETAAVVILRPTKSRPLFAQMAGRGARPKADGGDCLLIVMDPRNAGHKLVRPVDMLDGPRVDPEVLEIAEEMIRAEKGLDLTEAIERGEKEHRERQVLRIEARERDVRFRSVSYDPFSVCDALGIPNRFKSPDQVIRKASKAQVQCLAAHGVKQADGLSSTKASTLLSFLKSRRLDDKATVRQVGTMIARGVDPVRARAMTFQEASAFLDSVFQKRA